MMAYMAWQAEQVSIRTPVKGVIRSELVPLEWLRGFNPHPREGGDSVLPSILSCRRSVVSIRTPVKGVIKHKSKEDNRGTVSIRTPVKGVI